MLFFFFLKKGVKTYQRRLDLVRWQTYGGIGFGCSISTGISQSFHLSNKHPKTTRLVPPRAHKSRRNVENKPFYSISGETGLIYQLFLDEACSEKGAVRWRLYYCCCSAPQCVHTWPSPTAASLSAAELRSRAPEWPFSLLIGQRAGGWGDRESEANTTHTYWSYLYFRGCYTGRVPNRAVLPRCLCR